MTGTCGRGEWYVATARDWARPGLLVIQIAKCVDYLDCEIWQYLGARVTTAAKVRAVFPKMLAVANDARPEEWPPFTRCTLRRA